MEEQKVGKNMRRFSTKAELEAAWVAQVVSDSRKANPNETLLDLAAAAAIEAKSYLHYSPIHYRGGWVIPGFGYSTERIGVYVESQDVGDPASVGLVVN